MMPINSRPQHQDRTILVVDDHHENVHLLQMYLSGKGYKVEFAGNGIEALEIMGQHSNIALVITDINMPGMGGNELCRLIQETSKEVPIIAMSSDPYSAVAPFNEVFSKPFRADELCQTVDELISTKVDSYE